MNDIESKAAIEARFATVLGAHQWYDATADSEGPAVRCTSCDDWYGDENAVNDGTFGKHQAEMLSDAIAEAQAAVLRGSADAFQVNTWASILTGSWSARTENGQQVSDWLRTTADQLVNP